MSARRFTVDLPLELIQALRLTHALMESDYQVTIPREHTDKFSYLASEFNLVITPSQPEDPVLGGLKIIHPPPLTTVGNLSRPLVFPVAAFDRCLRRWSNARKTFISFAGLLTVPRKKIVESWNSKHSRVPLGLPDPEGIAAKLKRRILRVVGLNDLAEVSKISRKGITFWSSSRGRYFPVKAWDTSYFTLLEDSKFVLCPNGDFVWTYRFFEAAMCGAIPIVQTTCDIYNGFEYYTMENDPSSFRWSKEVAEHNFQLCKERLTIPRESLNQEIARLLPT